MHRKLSSRYRKGVFALAMSGSTALIVSAVILALRGVPAHAFLGAWAQAVFTAWPIVFVSILLIAPRIDRMLDRFVERGGET